MASNDELQRIAALANVLRPDWPMVSVLSMLQAKHTRRAYTELAVAMTIVACDPVSRTPARLNEMGPWWIAINGHSTPSVGPGAEPRCQRPGHEHELARACRCCRADRLAADDLED